MDESLQDTPVYRKFLFFLKKGFAALNDEQQLEIREFIQSQQNAAGAFTNRAGFPDYYYSLFGNWLSVALDLVISVEKHKQFILQPGKSFSNPVDEFAVLLIKVSLLEENFRKPSLFRLLKSTFFNIRRVSLYYRLFLFVLLADALYQKRMLIWAARGFMIFVSPPSGSPCSIWAAYLVARRQAGFNVSKELAKLNEFFEAGKGFKAFTDIAEADLLSTAVALYALKDAGADLRSLAPDCLELIQQNYKEGAFTAGNGDEVRDLEYTFYGLLALGILV